MFRAVAARVGRRSAVSVAIAAVLVGCSSSGAVPVAEPTVTPGAVSVCRALHAALPSTLGSGIQQRATSPSSDATAAWGDPAIVLTCGVGLPAMLNPGSPSYDPSATDDVVNGVDWLTQQFTAGYRFTTNARSVFVQVDVPDHYAPEVDPLVALAGAIATTDPLNPNVP